MFEEIHDEEDTILDDCNERGELPRYCQMVNYLLHLGLSRGRRCRERPVPFFCFFRRCFSWRSSRSGREGQGKADSRVVDRGGGQNSPIHAISHDDLTKVDDVLVSSSKEGLDLAQPGDGEPIWRILHFELLQRDNFSCRDVLSSRYPAV